MTAVRWDREEVILEGDDWFDRLIDAIGQARRSIDVELYILNADGTGRALVDALRAAGGRGVQVRLLVDGIGSSDFIWSVVPELYRSPVIVRVYHPSPGQVLSPVFRHGSRVANLLRLLPRINRRDHRKLVIIDGREAFVGSFNIGDFIRASCDRDHWFEGGAVVAGPAIAELGVGFEASWDRAWRFHRQRLPMLRFWPRRSRRIPASGLVVLNHRMALRRLWWRDLCDRIDRAQERIWIVAAYFVPHVRLIRALSAASRRGVEVRLLMSERSDIRFMPWVAAAFWHGLLAAGVRIQAYRPGILHAKVVRIDRWLRMGSSNLNHRSLLHDLEVDVVLRTEGAMAAFEQAFVEGLGKSVAVTRETYAAWPWYWRLAGRVALVGRRFL